MLYMASDKKNNSIVKLTQDVPLLEEKNSSSMNESDKKMEVMAETGAAALSSMFGMIISHHSNPLIGAYATSIINPSLRRLAIDAIPRRQQNRIECLIKGIANKIVKKIDEGAVFSHCDDKKLLEINEGLLIAARDSYEEKKIDVLSSIAANSPLLTSVPLQDMVEALKITEQISFRKISIISAIGKNVERETNAFFDFEMLQRNQGKMSFEIAGYLTDILSLMSIDIINQREKIQFNNELEHVQVNGKIVPGRLTLGYMGQVIYRLGDLDTFSSEEEVRLAELFKK